ncbi:hypothetical protein BR93DRAFT_930832 [Coniochaeta sp. PMI_546]|nr:hypothetical protein BR93DRAFT_930832 [Coniochaeta sp. PMI_546]
MPRISVGKLRFSKTLCRDRLNAQASPATFRLQGSSWTPVPSCPSEAEKAQPAQRVQRRRSSGVGFKPPIL